MWKFLFLSILLFVKTFGKTEEDKKDAIKDYVNNDLANREDLITDTIYKDKKYHTITDYLWDFIISWFAWFKTIFFSKPGDITTWKKVICSTRPGVIRFGGRQKFVPFQRFGHKIAAKLGKWSGWNEAQSFFFEDSPDKDAYETWENVWNHAFTRDQKISEIDIERLIKHPDKLKNKIKDIYFDAQKYFTLQIGDGIGEACHWNDKAPKIIDYEFSAHLGSANMKDVFKKGTFNFYIIQGNKGCGSRTANVLAAVKNIDDAYKQKIAARYAAREFYPTFDGDDDVHAKITSVNPGQFWKANEKTSRSGSVYTNALMDTERSVCGIFYCTSDYSPCAVNLQKFSVSYMTRPGFLRPNKFGTSYGKQTPKDLFTIGFLIFDIFFITIQCCCCCAFIRMEITGGEIDDDRILQSTLYKLDKMDVKQAKREQREQRKQQKKQGSRQITPNSRRKGAW